MHRASAEVLYTFAILFNILLDAAVGGYIAYRTAATLPRIETRRRVCPQQNICAISKVANHARTYGGILVEDLTRAQAIFESFEIQLLAGTWRMWVSLNRFF